MNTSTSALTRDFDNVVSDAQDLLDTTIAGGRARAKTADEYVRGNPWPMIGASAAVGALVGYFLARRY